jgi:hypothetical protein
MYQELNARGLPIARYYKYGPARLGDLYEKLEPLCPLTNKQPTTRSSFSLVFFKKQITVL